MSTRHDVTDWSQKRANRRLHRRLARWVRSRPLRNDDRIRVLGAAGTAAVRIPRHIPREVHCAWPPSTRP